MGIIFESENSDLVIEFESDLLCENFSDRTSVLWKFHDRTHTRVVADVFDCTPASESRPNSLLPTVRLRSRYDEEKL